MSAKWVVIFILTILTIIVLRNQSEIEIIRYIEHAKDSVVGDLKYSTMSHDFHGWLICDGRSLSRSTYHKLFRVIGTTYGSANAESFNLPDARGRVIGLSGQGAGLSLRRDGDKVGEETHVMALPELVSHAHTGTISQSGQHVHTGTVDQSGQHNHSITDPGHSHTQVTVNDDFNNSGGSPPSFSADSAGLRTWNNINASTTGIVVNNAGQHAHTFTSDSSGQHTHTITISETGQSRPFNVMQPTLFLGHMFIFAGVEFSCHPDPTPH